jgi:hypothetical protein
MEKSCRHPFDGVIPQHSARVIRHVEAGGADGADGYDNSLSFVDCLLLGILIFGLIFGFILRISLRSLPRERDQQQLQQLRQPNPDRRAACAARSQTHASRS